MGGWHSFCSDDDYCILKEAPTFRFISQSILIERLKINGSLARIAIRHLEKEGAIKRIVHHHGQLVYSTY